ncbi:MAG TPA: J domain-containing protein [Spirochaetota bacterium]|nr:J domain-containing protein [Spirochaetota bacterium]HSA15154.1 J domain-containing protein [Spirochaetota bacterium]
MANPNKKNQATCYDLLGVAPESTAQEIKSAFRRKSFTAHPDRGGTNEEQARLNRAYEILSDPVKRKRYDRALSASRSPATERPRYRSARAAEWEKSFGAAKRAGCFMERVRKEMKLKSGEAARLRESSAAEMYELSRRGFMAVRMKLACSAGVVVLSGAAGFILPAFLICAVAAGYAAYRYSRFGSGDDAVRALDPDWEYILKKRARDRARAGSEAALARIEELSRFAELLVAAVKRPSSIRQGERAILRRLLIHFFLLGYIPESHDRAARLVLVRGHDETLAVRYRFGAGARANAAFAGRLIPYMKENGAQRGFLFTATGLSKKAAALADESSVAYYSVQEMNAWIAGAGRYQGPADNLLDGLDSFMSFMERM